MVATSSPSPPTSAMPTSSATNELGTCSVTRGQRNSTTKQMTPTVHASTFTVAMLSTSARTFSVVSMVTVPSGYVSPKKSFSCPMTNVTAMPAVNPVVMVKGTKRMTAPIFENPITISKNPAMIVAATKPSMPSVATIPATMVANAAVGPDICTRLPPRKEMRKPAMIAVKRPCSGETPEAMPRAMESERATTATTMPATISLGICRLSSEALECLMMLNRMGLILSRCIPSPLDILP